MESYLILAPEIRAKIQTDFEAGKTKNQIIETHKISRIHLKHFFPERFRQYAKVKLTEEQKAIRLAQPKQGPGRPKKIVI